MSLTIKCATVLLLLVAITVGAGAAYLRLESDGAGTQTMLLVQGAAGALTTLICVVGFWRRVSRAIARVGNYAQAVDLQVEPLPDTGIRRRDEIGLMAGEVNLLARRSQDLLKRRDAQLKQSRENEERYASAMLASADGVWDWEVAKDKVYFSPRLRAMLGEKEKAATLSSQEWFELVHPEDRESLTQALQVFASDDGAPLHVEHRVRRTDGSHVWMLCRGTATRTNDGRAARVVGLLTDITPQKEREELLAHEAMHDVLTGLANRAMLVQQLNHAVGRAKRKDYHFAILFMDLDRFKVINDGLGHHVGDELLKGVSSRIATSVRATDTIGRCNSTVARLGGDEFVVLLDDIYDVMDGIRVAERIQKSIAEPFHLHGHEIYSSTSIGIALGDSETESGAELLRNADTALYRAKAMGKACYAVFDMEMGKRAKRRLSLETDLRKAIEREELAPHYQPIIDLKTGKIHCFEVLVRWNHPELGNVSPEEFIGIAEETDTIQAMGRWLLRTAARQTRTWQQRFPHAKGLSVSVNFSAKEFLQDKVAVWIREDLDTAGLPPQFLKVEVTETLLMKNAKQIVNSLAALRGEGVQIAIDDFGTGYSSLSYLTKFPVNVVKIDLSFVRDMHASPECLQLVRSILSLSQSLNLQVIAEGVEEAHQLERLKGLSCEMGQGYYFSRPLDTTAATKLLESDPTW